MTPLNALAGGFGSGLGSGLGGGGSSAPLMSSNGDVLIEQGGFNVPDYPLRLLNEPVDNDSLFISKSEDLTLYYVAAGLALLMILKRKK